MSKILELFWIFFKIGLFTFGGGYAMIPLFKHELVSRNLITLEALMDFIAIGESTPGPFAVNIASFVGMSTNGVMGAIFTTLGVILPSFIIILFIARYSSKLLDSNYAIYALDGIKPAVVGLILGAAITILLANILPEFHFIDNIQVDSFHYQSFIIFIIIMAINLWRKKISPIFLIGLSALLGLLIYGLNL